MFNRICALLALLLASTFAFAQPLADRIPADAIVYIGWQGGDSVGAPYEKSHLKAVLDSSNLPQVFSEFLPRAIEQVGKNDQQAAAMFRSVHGIARVLWQKPTAIYFGGIDPNPQMPMPKITILCDSGGDAQALLNSINPMIETLNRAGAPIVGAVHGKRYLTLSIGADIAAPFAGLLGDASDKTSPPLSTKKEFTDSIAQLQKQSTVALYIDAEAAIKLVDQMMAGQGEAPAQNWKKVLDNGGLAGLKRIAATAGFDGANWSTNCFVLAPAPRKGLLTILDSKPLTDDILKTVPKSASYVGAFRFDIARAFEGIRNIAGAMDPQGQQQFDQFTGMAQAMTTVNLQTQLFEPLGDQWVIYSDANVGGTSMMGFALVNKLDDPKTVEQSLDKLGLAITNMISTQMPREANMAITLRQTKVDDLTIRYFALPLFAPAWTIKDGNLYVSLQPQVTASAAALGAGKSGSILQNEGFIAARKLAGAGGAASSIKYIDLQQTITGSYATTLAMLRFGIGMADMAGMQAPALVVPPLHKLREHLGPASTVAWTDDAGWHSKSVTPFPGAELFATEANMLVAQQAMVLSILLPALNTAKERANRVKCASNMRQMGMGVLLYANENRGKYPPTIGDLVAMDLNWQVFTCPTGAHVEPPPPDVQADPKKLAAWVNENAHYVYLGANMNANMGADRLLMYEKADNHGQQGLNLLYNDGHVEWQHMQGALQEIQRQQQPAPGAAPAPPAQPRPR
jgi:prepilin-type processing-associated H-X9-DG protein